uniref:Uncharacterized protein n=1 Tax=Sinocyclocheilus rhinocerous TaxID=307959 RepID=A0A673HN91_9TELE
MMRRETSPPGKQCRLPGSNQSCLWDTDVDSHPR